MRKMIWIIDRIENDIAVCEVNEKMIDVPLFALPVGIKEGDILTVSKDSEQTEKRQENINNLMNTLFKD